MATNAIRLIVQGVILAKIPVALRKIIGRAGSFVLFLPTWSRPLATSGQLGQLFSNRKILPGGRGVLKSV
jgi:hypothetical protein